MYTAPPWPACAQLKKKKRVPSKKLTAQPVLLPKASVDVPRNKQGKLSGALLSILLGQSESPCHGIRFHFEKRETCLPKKDPPIDTSGIL